MTGRETTNSSVRSSDANEEGILLTKRAYMAERRPRLNVLLFLVVVVAVRRLCWSPSLPAPDVSFRPVDPSRERTGTWVANQWFPPAEWTYFRVQELQDLYRGTRMLWVGDDQASALTFFALLNSSSRHVSVQDVKAKAKSMFECQKWLTSAHRPQICRALPGNGTLLSRQETCFVGVERFLRDELQGVSNITSDMHLLVLSLGIWEIDMPDSCSDKKRTLHQVITSVVKLLDKLSEMQELTVVWTTSGFSDSKRGRVEEVRAMNTFAMDEIDRYSATNGRKITKLTYVNWGGAVEPRSFSPTRIKGADPSQYGLEPRLVLVQMITNILKERGFLNSTDDRELEPS
jgi:hypothetical protein